MNVYPPFGGADARSVDFETAEVTLLPVPYAGTVSYGGGAAQGPAAILAASAQLEMYDEELDWCIDTAGLFTLPRVEVAGLLPEQVMKAVHHKALPSLAAGKLLCTLGGEHSISYGVLTALLVQRKRPFSLLQIDAHADLRESYQGNRHSHACIMARVRELGIPFVQVGLRSCSAAEWEWLRDSGQAAHVFWARDIARAEKDGAWMDQVLAKLGPEVYLTVDVDGLDPSVIPATGTPEPGGLSWYTLLHLLRKLGAERRIIGFDVMELAPIPGWQAPDYTAARLVYKLIGYALHSHRHKNRP